MAKRIPKDDDEEKLKFGVIGRALDFDFMYSHICGKDCLYHNFSRLPQKDKYLVKLFYATDNLRDFLHCFPTPKKLILILNNQKILN